VSPLFRSRGHGLRSRPRGEAPFSRLVDLLLQSGFSAGDTAKIVGGNFLRVFEAATA
jgi:microsomal dipeptidase-like Zn-dependent dipeptidase